MAFANLLEQKLLISHAKEYEATQGFCSTPDARGPRHLLFHGIFLEFQQELQPCNTKHSTTKKKHSRLEDGRLQGKASSRLVHATKKKCVEGPRDMSSLCSGGLLVVAASREGSSGLPSNRRRALNGHKMDLYADLPAASKDAESSSDWNSSAIQSTKEGSEGGSSGAGSSASSVSLCSGMRLILILLL
jgi:hypothetical protein